jgi:hypothetical protein
MSEAPHAPRAAAKISRPEESGFEVVFMMDA